MAGEAARGGGGRPGSAAAPPVAGEAPQLSAAQWAQLTRHRAIFCAAPPPPPPSFDEAWLSSRSFITSARLPRARAGGVGPRLSPGEATAGGGGGPAGQPGAAGGRWRSPTRLRGGGKGRVAAGGSAGDAPEGQAAAEEEGRGEGADPASEARVASAGSGAAGADGNGGSPATEGEAEDGAVAMARARAQRVGARASVADAADLLRELAAQRRRGPRHGPRDGAAADSAGEVGSGSDGGSDAGEEEGLRGDGGDEADAGWLPQPLPRICYDDVALQALDKATWRDACEALLRAAADSSPQSHMGGCNGIWIVKPAGAVASAGLQGDSIIRCVSIRKC